MAIRGPLDAAALDRALDALIARHEALRTRLVAGQDSHPVQVIDPAGARHRRARGGSTMPARTSRGPTAAA